MEIPTELLDLVAAGGDVFTIAVCFFLYKHEKRITDLEIENRVQIHLAREHGNG